MISRFKTLFAPPSNTDEEGGWRYRLLNLALWTLLPTSTIAGLVIASQSTSLIGGLVGAGVSAALAAILILLMHRGRRRLASYVLGYGICVGL